MSHINTKRSDYIRMCLFITLCFLWTGSAYITWLYRLSSAFDSFSASYLSEGIGYLFQSAGILLLSMIIKYKPHAAVSSRIFTAAVIADAAAMSAAILCPFSYQILFFGLIMNLMHGVIAGIYLTQLSLFIPQNKMGTVFGLSYGLGSIGSYLLSLPEKNTLLHSNIALIIYYVLILSTLFVYYDASVKSRSAFVPAQKAERPYDTHKHKEVAIHVVNQRIPNVYRIAKVFEENVAIRSIITQFPLLTPTSYNLCKNPSPSDTDYLCNNHSASGISGNPCPLRKSDLLLIAVVMILLSVVKGIGFYFPISQSQSGTVSLEFSRSFYAIGLVAAGIIGDKSRKYGAVCCLSALVFPFISLALNDVQGISDFIWISGYIFFGFFAVYRVVVFCDIAANQKSLLWMAGFGLLFGRIGDAAGTTLGMIFENHTLCLISVSTALFIITVILFFAMYHKLYIPVLTTEQETETLLSEFEQRYGLSSREREVFRLIVTGCSNAEIAGKLYISESTVKFHVKNILKKTSCTNRTGLAAKVKKH